MVRTPIRLLVTSAVLTTALVATAGPAQAAEQFVIDHGHVDVVGVAFEDGQLHLHVHDESVEPGVEREPEDVEFRVLPGAETVVPADPSFAFLGDAGDPVWILPQAENPELIFAGFGAEEIDAGVLRDDSVTVTFVGAGPGDVAIYTENAVGLPADILVDTGDGQPDSFTLAAGEHAHANWAFEQPGDYRFLVVVSGRLASDGKPIADAGIYHFTVLG
jgi:surface-anchored protein